MNLDVVVANWRDFADMVAPQQPSFDLIYAVIGYAWLVVGASALFMAMAKNTHTPLMIEMADILYLTTVLLTLGGVLLGFYITAAAIIASVGGTVTFIIYRRIVEQTRRWLTDTESRSYMRAGLATVGTNGMCVLALLAS